MSSSRSAVQLLRAARAARVARTSSQLRSASHRSTLASPRLAPYQPAPSPHRSTAPSLAASFSSSHPVRSFDSSTVSSHNFDSISGFVASPSPSRILIDVREPSELKSTGRIPGAQNMPINSAPDGLFLPAEEFLDRFGFEKPKADEEVVFYCKAGVRSRAAARVAKMAGYEKVGEYPGSWMDWEENGGQVEK